MDIKIKKDDIFNHGMYPIIYQELHVNECSNCGYRVNKSFHLNDRACPNCGEYDIWTNPSGLPFDAPFILTGILLEHYKSFERKDEEINERVARDFENCFNRLLHPFHILQMREEIARRLGSEKRSKIEFSSDLMNIIEDISPDLSEEEKKYLYFRLRPEFNDEAIQLVVFSITFEEALFNEFFFNYLKKQEIDDNAIEKLRKSKTSKEREGYLNNEYCINLRKEIKDYYNELPESYEELRSYIIRYRDNFIHGESDYFSDKNTASSAIFLAVLILNVFIYLHNKYCIQEHTEIL